MEIRCAAPSEIDLVAAVYRRSSLFWDEYRAGLMAAPELLAFDGVAVEQQRTRVAVEDGVIVGFATLAVPDGAIVELDDLFVDPDHMRRGVGRMLIDDLVSIARTSGCTRIEVTANIRAVPFYEAVGFVADGIAQTTLGPAPRMHLDVA